MMKEQVPSLNNKSVVHLYKIFGCICRFNIITFSDTVRAWNPDEMLEANTANIRKAKGYVREIYAVGGK